MASETRDKLVADADKNRKALEDRLDARLAEAEKTIAATKTAAMTNVRGIAVETTAAIVAAPDRRRRRRNRRWPSAVDDVLKR